MQRMPVLTKDGSHTIEVPGLNATYHSIHGAVTESRHVFIGTGLEFRLQQPFNNPLRILEMGLGTGLNLLLTYIALQDRGIPVHYTGVEAFPLEKDILEQLNYTRLLERKDLDPVFIKIHSPATEREIELVPDFILKRKNETLQSALEQPSKFDLVYFDAFAPTCQPELWTAEIFWKLFERLDQGAVLVTYCSKGDVRRALQSVGFTVEKLPGPPGKREMLRAVKS